jgi:hypothetical protein
MQQPYFEWRNKRNESRRTHFELQPPDAGGAELLFLLPFLLSFLLRFFDVVLDHELAPQRNLLTNKITQHFWVASHNLNALCF